MVYFVDVDMGAGAIFAVTEIGADAAYGDVAIGDYAMQLGGFQSGEYLYELGLNSTLSSGNYACGIIVEQISPVDLLS